MRIANLKGRAVLVTADGQRALDVFNASSGRFGPDPASVFDDWRDFQTWAAMLELTAAQPFRRDLLGPPSPRPRQILAVGLNYRDHAAEADAAVPREPNVLFTKWASCLTGPDSTVELPARGNTDWEVELVVVIGRRSRRLTERDAWGHVAGLTVGQDLSERLRQNEGATPQFSLAKSLPGFGPTGPWLISPDEFTTPDDLELGCILNGEHVQKSRTSDMVFSVPTLLAWLSGHVTLLPGDLVFTGTPAGVGLGRTPPRYLRPGDQLTTYITGIGELRQRFHRSNHVTDGAPPSPDGCPMPTPPERPPEPVPVPMTNTRRPVTPRGAVPSPFVWPYGHNATDGDELSLRASLLAVLGVTVVACVAIAACAYFFGL